MDCRARPRPTTTASAAGSLCISLLESDAWVITENCAKLIDGLPLLVRDDDRVEDIRKVDGDDAADAARYGLVSGGRFAGITAQLARSGSYGSRSDFDRGDDSRSEEKTSELQDPFHL